MRFICALLFIATLNEPGDLINKQLGPSQLSEMQKKLHECATQIKRQPAKEGASAQGKWEPKIQSLLSSLKRTGIYHEFEQYKNAAASIKQFSLVANSIKLELLKQGEEKEVIEKYVGLCLSTGNLYKEELTQLRDGSLLRGCLDAHKDKINQLKSIQKILKQVVVEMKNSDQKSRIQKETEAVVDAWLKDQESGIASSKYESSHLSSHPINPKNHRILQWSYDINRLEYVVLVDLESTNKGSQEIRNRWIVGVSKVMVTSFSNSQQY